MNLLTYNFLLTTITAEVSLIIDVFLYKSINNGIHFHCSSAQTTISVQKILNCNDMLITTTKIQDGNRYNIPLSYRKFGVIVNTNCSGWSRILYSLNLKTAFKNPYIWFIITENLYSTVDILLNYPIDVDSDVTILYKNGDVYELHEIYNTGYYNERGVWNVKKVGYWNLTLHVEKRDRLNLQGITLKATVVIAQKVVNTTFEQYLEQPRPLTNDPIHRLKFYTLLKYLKDMYNISYTLQRTNSWGYLNNGSFDGMVGVLQRREADIGGSPVFFKKSRAEVVDYVVATWNSRQSFIFLHPKYPGGYLTIYSRPMTINVWYCTVALLSLAAVILCFMLKIRVLKDDGENDSSPSLGWLSIWSAVCQQGISLGRDATSIKIVVFVTFIFTLTLYQYYNATIVSSLLRDPPKSIRTLEDLLNSNLKVGVEDVLYNKDYLKRTTDCTAIKLYNKKITNEKQYNFFTPEVGMALVKRGGFAFHVDAATGYRIMKSSFTEKQLCTVHEVLLYQPQYTNVIVKKGSPYKEHIVYGIRRMFESGLASRLKSIWDESKPTCVRTPDTGLFNVSIQEFSMALIVIVFGSALATLVLLAEIYINKKIVNKGFIEFNH